MAPASECDKEEKRREERGGGGGEKKQLAGLVERYAEWYRTNEHWVQPLEQALQSALWFIPSSREDEAGTSDGGSSEVVIELLHSLASMFTVVNEQALLLTDGDERLEELREVQRKFPAALLPLLVATVEQFETVAECVLIQRYESPSSSSSSSSSSATTPLNKTIRGSGRNQKYKWLCFIELSKALLRLGQLYKSDRFSCMLLDGGTSGVGKAIPFDRSMNKADRQRVESFQTFRAKYLSFHPKASMGMGQQANNKTQDEDLCGVPRALMPKGGEGQVTLDLSLQDAQLLTLAEILHIFRPVIYCSLLWRDGVKSWKPWVSTLAVEVTSLAITSKITAKAHCLKANPLCMRESQSRWARLILYMARSPFYDRYTKRSLTKVRDLLKPIPLLGMATDAGYNLMDDIQSYYTYTSG